jgi:two-component system chemotaxis response regulator CheY
MFRRSRFILMDEFSTAQSSGSKTVLVIEDDEDVRSVICDVLEDSGYLASGARNGQQAIELLESGLRPKLIVLDLTMPIMDGWSFRHWQLGESTVASIPVLLLSAIRNLGAEADELATVGVIEKPVDLDSLLDAVARHVA